MDIRAQDISGSIRKRTRTVLLFVGALLFLFEEWLWVRFTHFFVWLGRQPATLWIERKLARVPPIAALIILCIPMAILFPFKIAGLWMIATGHFLSGCALMCTAKILSTAIVARIFVTCQPQLMRMPWFARLYAWTLALSRRVHVWIDQQPAWHGAKRSVRRARAHVWAWAHGMSFAHAESAGPMRRGLLMRWRTRRKAQRRRHAAAVKARDSEAR
jgi:hypothetical protein